MEIRPERAATDTGGMVSTGVPPGELGSGVSVVGGVHPGQGAPEGVNSGETDPEGLDLTALAAFLDAEHAGLRTGPLSGSLLSGGRSNLTYLVEDAGEQWVLRRPPLGHVLATAHDMSREYRFLDSLWPTAVPVPEPLALIPAAVLGVQCYLMRFSPGTIFRSATSLQKLDTASTEKLVVGMMGVLAALHEVDPAKVGLGDLGRPHGYLDRQLARWTTQLASSHSRHQEALGKLMSRLAVAVPKPQRAGLVHGDYRLDNLVINAANPGVVEAVLDWEMATQGDPLTDLASAVMWWDGIAGLNSPVAAVPGEFSQFPSSDALLEAYSAQSPLDLSDINWYLAFSFYKTAAIFEGINYRYEQGLTVGTGFNEMGAMVPHLIDRGNAALSGQLHQNDRSPETRHWATETLNKGRQR